jgi:hypothetical protein
MASRKPKVSKQAAAGITWHITFTSLETLEIIRKPGNATRYSVIMAAYKIGLLNTYDINNRKKLPVRNYVSRDTL